MRQNLHCDIGVNVKCAADPDTDAWKGARIFSNNEENRNYFITREEYNEYGPDYFKDHWCSNLPILQQRNNTSFPMNNDNTPVKTPNKKQKI